MKRFDDFRFYHCMSVEIDCLAPKAIGPTTPELNPQPLGDFNSNQKSPVTSSNPKKSN
jgi:hypothetical protein